MKLLDRRVILGMSCVSECFSWVVVLVPEDTSEKLTIEQMLTGCLGPIAAGSIELPESENLHETIECIQKELNRLHALLKKEFVVVTTFVDDFALRSKATQYASVQRVITATQKASVLQTLVSSIFQTPISVDRNKGGNALMSVAIPGKIVFDGELVPLTKGGGGSGPRIALATEHLLKRFRTKTTTEKQQVGMADAFAIVCSGMAF